MIIKQARFVQSLDRVAPFPGQGAPEIAMAGKSNVGKSSSINRLTRHNKLARVSGEPGKTRLINLYSLNNDQIMLVDLPGYGFARAPKSEKERWGRMIEGYLSGSPYLRHVLQLVDIRHAPTGEDQMMINYLRHYDIPFTVIANKADKVSRAERGRTLPVICRTLAVQPWEVIPFSAETGMGTDRILELMESVTQSHSEEMLPSDDGNEIL